MKKRHLFWIIPTSIITLGLLVFLVGNLISPVKPLKYVTKPKNINNLTEVEVKQDLEYVKYYFENVYVGYQFLQENGYDIDSICNEVYDKYVKEKGKNFKIDRGTFSNDLTKALFKDFSITDMHISIDGKSANSRKVIFFSDIYLREKNVNGEKKYFVYKNEIEPIPEDIMKSSKRLPPAEVKIGQEYTGPVSNLYKCYDGDEIVYRYAVYTDKKISKSYINVERKNVWAPVLPSINISKAKMQGFVETEKTLYFGISAFSFGIYGGNNAEFGKRELQNLCDTVKEKSVGKENVIVDLRNNGGGSTFMRDAIFGNLLYNQREVDNDLLDKLSLIGMNKEISLFSPSFAKGRRMYFWESIIQKWKEKKFDEYTEEYEFETVQENERKYWNKKYLLLSFLDLFYHQRKNIEHNNVDVTEMSVPEPDFKGNIIFLTNKNSASCSEYSLALLREFENFDGINVYHIGENTCGAVSFINPHTVVLPNSGIWCYLPNAYNDSDAFKHSKYHGESEGWHPDFWCSSFQILNVLTNLLEDDELSTALQGIERRQL